MVWKTWKRAEKEIAKRLGCRRNVRAPYSPDAEGEWLVLEVKSREVLPKYLKEGLENAVEFAFPQKLGLLVLHEKGIPYDEAIVCLRLKDFLDNFGGE